VTRMASFVALSLTASLAMGGIYNPSPTAKSPSTSNFLPDEKLPFQIREGIAQPLAFGTHNDGEFPSRFAVLTNLLDSNPKRTSNPDRQTLLDRIRQFETLRDGQPKPNVFASHAADLIRTGQPDKAINVLQTLSRGRSAGFAVLMNLAHAHAMKGDWESALRTHEVALDYDAKDDLKAMSPEQIAWVVSVEKKYYRPWLSWNLKNPKPNPETDGPSPLFGPLKFLNDAGQYEPGNLSASEKAKLPPDAVAVVQQMLLWNPTDTNLYWLLAELYAAEGKLRQAAVIFDQCAWSRQFSNRKVMMAHREVVNAAVAKLPPEQSADEMLSGFENPPAPSGDGLPSMQNVIIALAVATPVILFLLFIQIRVFARKLRAARRID
jgi:hypothetical protein